MSEGNVVKYQIQRAEPLRLELEAFVRAVGTRDPSGVASLDDGIAAITLADAMRESAKDHRIVNLEHAVGGDE